MFSTEAAAAAAVDHQLMCLLFCLSRSRCLPESFPEEKSATTVKVEVQPPYPFSQKLLSSEESDDEEQADAADLHATPWHPKPLGVSTGSGSCWLVSGLNVRSSRAQLCNGYLSPVPETFIRLFLVPSYALLDAARWAAASLPLTGVCTTCTLLSMPCWSSMGMMTPGSEFDT